MVVRLDKPLPAEADMTRWPLPRFAFVTPLGLRSTAAEQVPSFVGA